MSVQTVDLSPITAVNFNGTALTQVKLDGMEIWPQMLYISGYRGVIAPELQWIMSAQGGSSIAANTNIDLSNGESTVYTGNWTSVYASTIGSYTNILGATKYYYPLSGGSMLKTSTATSSNSDIIANGGFTMWITMFAYSATSGWSRPFNYFNLASVSTATVPNSGDQYRGPSVFMKRDSSYFQIARPSGSTSSASGNSNTFLISTTNPLTMVVRMSSSGVMTHWLRDPAVTVNAVNMTISGSGPYGIRTTANSAWPTFADDIYWNQSAFNGIMESGFANRPFTDAECLSLVDNLNDEFKRV